MSNECTMISQLIRKYKKRGTIIPYAPQFSHDSPMYSESMDWLQGFMQILYTSIRIDCTEIARLISKENYGEDPDLKVTPSFDNVTVDFGAPQSQMNYSMSVNIVSCGEEDEIGSTHKCTVMKIENSDPIGIFIAGFVFFRIGKDGTIENLYTGYPYRMIVSDSWGGDVHDVECERFNTTICKSAMQLTRFCFGFINCKNVELKDVPVRKKWKGKKRVAVPGIFDKQVVINPSKAKYKSKGGDGVFKNVMPLHLCRGHFRTYNEEKPLFGKVAGMFWVPQHTKGRAENGVIDHSYKVEK